jgi:outer membrane immunogenic protein
MSKLTSIMLKTVVFLSITSASYANGIKIKLDSNDLDKFAQDTQYDWSGFYTGGSINYTAQFRGTGQLTDEGYGALQPKGQGPKGGVFAGYNFQINSFVLGIEADASYGWNNDHRFMTGAYQGNQVPLNYKFNQNASYSLRARLGYAFNDLMVFGTLGMASSDIKNSGLIIAKGNSQQVDVLYNAFTRGVENGYAMGIGFEYGIDSNWIARAEYIYSNYDRKSPFWYYDVRMGLQEHEIRTGLAYKF